MSTRVIDSFPSPVSVAPMAGGPTTPALVRAADAAGSFSALALGTSPMNVVAQQLDAMEGARFGLNLFHPQPPLTKDLWAAAQTISDEEGVVLGHVDYTFGWHEKLALALAHDNRPAVIWSMFGTFSDEEIQRIHEAGIEAWTTVTTAADALVAARRGVDVLCVQGADAGGHRGTWTIEEEPDWRPLRELVADVHAALEAEGFAIPLIAAGGLRDHADVEEALGWPGVAKVSCGSAFLLAEEAGTSESNRELIASGGETVSTRALSGRYARGLATDYTRTHPDMAPIYPHLSPLLKTRRAQKDPAVAYCLVGVEPERLGGGSVAEILQRL
ncbi:oxidoreductase, 2-nitropropane dioxygenase family protein [Corynebacterium sp. CMW7794]|uniref:nitronate monooxygenase n=1 Tax=Corynebacterium sp. CMW7794 TaxID=1603887 RepID=UPI00079CAC1E|nr:nitronate monooxygenase [Corynebacterium sp. CMW7794]KXI18685.1 oxidoreductase, 2-nitropropane dioxygenase family protein [Corynebacterium sp. CMW7794]